jgi:molybdopterin synthase sulfur carrier subunit
MPAATIVIPPPLRQRTGNRTTVIAHGQNVRELIDALDQDYPGLFFNLCYETGELRPYVNIFINREDIRRLQGLNTLIPSEATVYILQSVAGG